VRKVLDALTAENLLLRRQGKGTFVAEHNQDRALFRFFHIARPGGERLVPEAASMKVKSRLSRTDEREKLKLKNGEAVFEIARLRLVGGKPAIRETIILPQRLFPKLDRIGNLPNTLYSLYQSRYGITIATACEELRAAAATKTDQSALGVKAGSPILVIGRLALSLTDQPVEWRESRVRTDHLVYAVALH
jgi:GntR family transcriptional regulator